MARGAGEDVAAGSGVPSKKAWVVAGIRLEGGAALHEPDAFPDLSLAGFLGRPGRSGLGHGVVWAGCLLPCL